MARLPIYNTPVVVERLVVGGRPVYRLGTGGKRGRIQPIGPPAIHRLYKTLGVLLEQARCGPHHVSDCVACSKRAMREAQALPPLAS